MLKQLKESLMFKVEDYDLDKLPEPHYKEDLISNISNFSDLKNKNVIVTIHGFSGTPRENEKTINFIKSKNKDYIFSQIMLGSHGYIQKFRNSTWKDWQSTIEKELDFLEKNDFKNIKIIGHSTGATLLMELLNRKKYSNISKIALVAPIVVTYNKSMKFIKFFYHTNLVKSIANDIDELQAGHWFKELPVSALYQLNDLTIHTRNNLKKGITLSDNTKLLIIQGKNDKIVDPISIEFWKKGIKAKYFETMMVDSKYHLVVVDRPQNDEAEIVDMVIEKIYNFLND
jgi:esterase/lipase